jgi:site-specific DNA-methyltransferase (adenine-specific)
VLNFTTFSLSEADGKERIEHLKQLNPNVILIAPPYNKPDGGGRRGSGSGSAIYQHFYNIAQQLDPEQIAMFIKANWYSGGRGDGLEEFREAILDDQHIKCWHDYPDPETYIDTDVALRGGVCRFLWSKSYQGKCDFYCHINDTVDYKSRLLRTQDHDILLRFNGGLSILEKVLATSNQFIKEGAYSRNAFVFLRNTGLSIKYEPYTTISP